jgi:NAD(P)-dependent dehydrogenase (short-subunit alcohol dehydrogenase family)
MTKDLENAVALVTGASRGIGAAIASELVRHGAHVFALARDKASLALLADQLGESCTPVPADLCSPSAFADLHQLVARRFGRLDVLVGNAAIMGRRTRLDDLEDQDWREVIDTNVTANWRLIRTFNGLLQSAPQGRAVFMTSGAGSRARMGAARGAYAISKSALNALVQTYASESEGTNLRVMLCNPGPIRTSLRAQAAPGEDPMTLNTTADIAPRIVEMCLPSWSESGRLYDYPQDRLLDFREPG